MTRPILPDFVAFPNEAAIIGRLLAGYAALELNVMNCVTMVRKDFDAVLKTMFRTRGETQRVDIADALGRNAYDKLELRTQFEMAISDLRYCLKIRNQYAHCMWWNDHSGKLALANLEEVAQERDHLTDLGSLTIHHVDVPLLESQEEFFVYVDNCFIWINYEGRRRAGEPSTPASPAPKQMRRPPLGIP